MVFMCPISFTVARPALSLATARGLLPLALVQAANLAAGLKGTAGLNLPMFIALRRFTLLFTITIERFWLAKRHDWPTLCAVALMVSGEWAGRGGGGEWRARWLAGWSAGRLAGRGRCAGRGAGRGPGSPPSAHRCTALGLCDVPWAITGGTGRQGALRR